MNGWCESQCGFELGFRVVGCELYGSISDLFNEGSCFSSLIQISLAMLQPDQSTLYVHTYTILRATVGYEYPQLDPRLCDCAEWPLRLNARWYKLLSRFQFQRAISLDGKRPGVDQPDRYCVFLGLARGKAASARYLQLPSRTTMANFRVEDTTICAITIHDRALHAG